MDLLSNVILPHPSGGEMGIWLFACVSMGPQKASARTSEH